MPLLIDAALAVLILAAALFLGSVGLALFKALKEEGSKDDDSKKSS